MFFPSGTNWESTLKEYGIGRITDPISFLSQHQDCLFCTRCSKEKYIVPSTWKGFPKDYYAGKITTKFCRYCERKNFSYGIISDLYGLVFHSDIIRPYDVHPSFLEDKDFCLLGNKVAEKVQSLGYKELLFYNTSPLMSIPYFKILLSSKISVYYTTQLWPNKNCVIMTHKKGFDL